MLEYSIKFWEPVISGCNQTPLPSFYIEPDVELLKYFNGNGSTVECTVFGTGMGAFDNQTFIATIDRSANLPNNRPNYYTATGLYIVTLNNYSNSGACGWWNGYPPLPGKVSFLVGPYKAYTPQKDMPVPVEMLMPTIFNSPVEKYEAPDTIIMKKKSDDIFFSSKKTWFFVLSVIIVAAVVISGFRED